MQPAKDVDQYIANAPKDVQERLEKLRGIIKSTVPGVEERISYAMAGYYYKGIVVYFGYWEKHIGLYALSAVVRDQFKKELSGYVMSKGTIQLPFKEKLPITLIKKLIKAQVKINTDDKKKNKPRHSV